ncbi:MAG TPA: hypothetical protein VFL98_02755 [Candidatus Paceibacterota bacterium]|nr:hypothetical protein [Candidatus Paceibacterota bacterium]
MEPITQGTGFAMIAAALVVDGLELIPGVDMIVDPIAMFLFAHWFAHHGYSLTSRRPFGYFGTAVIEFIPFISMIPAWLFLVWLSIRAQRREAAREGAV